MFVRTESFKEFINYYPVITTIIAINLTLYLLMNIPGAIGENIINLLVGVNFLIDSGQYWRIVTPVFSHIQLTHFLFNSFSLFLFGPPLEILLGRFKFLFIYLSTGMIANIATFLLKPPLYTHLGASGAIFGLFGYYIATITFKRSALPYESRQIIVTIAAISLIMTFLQSNINITAHLFGFGAGFVAGMLFPPKLTNHSF